MSQADKDEWDEAQKLARQGGAPPKYEPGEYAIRAFAFSFVAIQIFKLVMVFPTNAVLWQHALASAIMAVGAWAYATIEHNAYGRRFEAALKQVQDERERGIFR